MNKFKVIQIVGARPNFIKVAAIQDAFKAHSDVHSMIIHTGQHFDQNMSTVFFEELNMPKPDYYLGIQSSSHTQLTAEIMLSLEPILVKEKPNVLIVVGDVTSTLASALTAKRLNIPVIHVEAGLRSFDSSMPEEINRVLTDHISDLLFTTEESGTQNLIKENIPSEKIYFTGNCMIDTLLKYLPLIKHRDTLNTYALTSKNYIIMTMHRPSNVDQAEGLEKISYLLNYLSQHVKIIFPLHPRTRKNMDHFNMLENIALNKNIQLTEPLAYLDFLHLTQEASLVITDSGGIQEETTYLKVPCLTFRANTERPVTVSQGTNILLGDLNVETAVKEAIKILHGDCKNGEIPDLWDGHSAERMVEILLKKYQSV